MDAQFNWNDCYTGNTSDYEAPDPLLLELAATLPPGRALDIGCGAGGLLVALAERGWKVTGIDIAPRAIASARKVLAERSLAADLHAADATTWQPPGRYDLVASSFALPGDKAARTRVFAMMRAALAPGGTVLLKDFDASMRTVHAHFATFDSPTIDELTRAFADLDILRAEVVATPPHDHDGTGAHAGEHWTAALLHARNPVART